MNNIRNNPALFMIPFFTLVFLIGCNQNTPTPILEIQESEVAAPSPVPSLTPSATLVRTPATDIPLPPTQTHTPTLTSTSTPTQTSEPPKLIVNQDAVCRIGPGEIYDIRAYLSEGDAPVLLGQNGDDSWWSVEDPEFKNECWVSSDFVSAQGDLDSLPVFTPHPTPTIIPSPTLKAKGVRYFLVALNTGGPVGCGDTLIPVYIGVPSLSGPETDIRKALHNLFKLKVKESGGLYNPLHNAHLVVKNVTFNEATGNVQVHLAGSIPKPKDECEYHRVRGVLWETVRSYSGVKSLAIWIGNRHIGDLIAVIDR